MTIPISIVATPKVNLPHHRIHEGRYFSSIGLATGLPAGVAKDFLIFSPPATISLAHVIIIVSVNPGATFQLFEGSTVSSNGTTLNSFNSNRNIPVVATGFAFEDPIVLSTGLEIFAQIIGSITEGGIGGPLKRNDDEIIFKPLTNYLLRTTPFTGGTSLSIQMRAYRQGPI